MSKVIFDMSMSLDGFITAANRRPEEPLGEGGQRLHDWAFASDDDRDRDLFHNGAWGVGAMMCGRQTYDDSLPWWKADGPSGEARLPLIVITHNPPEDVPADACTRS